MNVRENQRRGKARQLMTLESLIADLEMCDESSGDFCLGLIYDLADEQGVWLSPFS